MGRLAVIAVMAIALCGCDVVAEKMHEWHHLDKVPASVMRSDSYKFLVAKFGSRNILVKCSYDEAADMGESYLWSIMDDSSDSHKYGETLGHGSSLQDAIDSAARSYLPGSTVKRLDDDWERRKAEMDKRAAQLKAKLKKDCNCD